MNSMSFTVNMDNDIERLCRYVNSIKLPPKELVSESLSHILNIYHKVKSEGWSAYEGDIEAEHYASYNIAVAVNILCKYHLVPYPQVLGTGEAKYSADPIAQEAFEKHGEVPCMALYHPHYADLSRSVILYNIFFMLPEHPLQNASEQDVIKYSEAIYHELHHHIAVCGFVDELGFSGEYIESLLQEPGVNDYVENAAKQYAGSLLYKVR